MLGVSETGSRNQHGLICLKFTQDDFELWTLPLIHGPTTMMDFNLSVSERKPCFSVNQRKPCFAKLILSGLLPQQNKKSDYYGCCMQICDFIGKGGQKCWDKGVCKHHPGHWCVISDYSVIQFFFFYKLLKSL